MPVLCVIAALVLMSAEMGAAVVPQTSTRYVSPIPSSWTAADIVGKLKSGDLTVAQILGPLQPAAGLKFSTLPDYSSPDAPDLLLAGEGNVLPRDRYNQVTQALLNYNARTLQPLIPQYARLLPITLYIGSAGQCAP